MTPGTAARARDRPRAGPSPPQAAASPTPPFQAVPGPGFETPPAWTMKAQAGRFSLPGGSLTPPPENPLGVHALSGLAPSAVVRHRRGGVLCAAILA